MLFDATDKSVTPPGEADRIVRENYFKVNLAVSQDDDEPQDEDPVGSGTPDEDDSVDELTEEHSMPFGLRPKTAHITKGPPPHRPTSIS